MISTTKLKIKFSSDYWKLWDEVEKAKLLLVLKTTKDELHESLITYDSLKTDGTFYPVPDGELLLLIFQTHFPYPERNHIFTTLRRWTPRKEEYYRSHISEWFNVEVKRGD